MHSTEKKKREKACYSRGILWYDGLFLCLKSEDSTIEQSKNKRKSNKYRYDYEYNVVHKNENGSSRTNVSPPFPLLFFPACQLVYTTEETYVLPPALSFLPSLEKTLKKKTQVSYFPMKRILYSIYFLPPKDVEKKMGNNTNQTQYNPAGR